MLKKNLEKIYRKKENTQKKYRNEIDKVDKEIAELLSRRLKLSYKIGEEKRKNNEDIYVPEREAEVLKNVANNSVDYSLEIMEIYKIIIQYSKKIQEGKFCDKC